LRHVEFFHVLRAVHHVQISAHKLKISSS
jgi:hypothetical protein